MRVNLHTHSSRSDGLLTPAGVMEKMAADGMEAASLTDHDTVSGTDEAIETGTRLGLKVIPGVELSSYSICEIHVLGYNFDRSDPAFVRSLERIADLRRTRIRLTVSRLREAGVPLDDSVLAAGGFLAGRVHVAREMIRQGFVQSVSEAFNRYLGTGGRACVAGHRITPAEAVTIIKEAGGTAVLAHPAYIPRDRLALLVDGLIPYGLDGIECHCPSSDAAATETCMRLVRRHNLIFTAGSDFHDPEGSAAQDYRRDLMDTRSLRALRLLP